MLPTAVRVPTLYQHQTFHFCCHLIQHRLEITTVTSIVKNFRWVTVLKRSKEKKHKESQRTTTPEKAQEGGAVNDSNLFEKSKATHPRATTTSNIRHLNFLVFFVIIFFFSSNSVPKFKQTKKIEITTGKKNTNLLLLPPLLPLLLLSLLLLP